MQRTEEEKRGKLSQYSCQRLVCVFLRTFLSGATDKSTHKNSFTCSSPIQNVEGEAGWGSEQHALVGGWN